VTTSHARKPKFHIMFLCESSRGLITFPLCTRVSPTTHASADLETEDVSGCSPTVMESCVAELTRTSSAALQRQSARSLAPIDTFIFGEGHALADRRPHFF
jgi:hypothetical protein